MAEELMRGLSRLYDVLLAGDADSLLALFSGEAHIDMPLTGAVHGEAAVRRMVAEQQLWLNARYAQPTLMHTIVTTERIVVELSVDLTQDGSTFDLPVAIAADRTEDGKKVRAIRVYHSTWPLNGSHIVRVPMLSVPDHLDEPEIVNRYMHAIGGKPDLETVLSLFEPDGYVRQPSGVRYKSTGHAEMRPFYSVVTGGQGIPLKHCTATFDGKACAIEFICDQWDTLKFAPQAGLAVYEMSARGLLAAARVYDDVSPPDEA